MAFFLTPRFAPAYTAPQCNPWACSPQPQPSCRRVVRSSLPSLDPVLSQFGELLSELNREAQLEAQREALRQRQQRKRIVRAHFNVHENKEGYQVDAEVPGFEQDHIEIEVTDENTLKLSGNTERKPAQQPQPTEPATEAQAIASEAQNDRMEGVTLNEPEETTASSAATPTHSDTESHKSYQPTVEDDFEDLGAETSSTISTSSSDKPKEPKGKERAVEEPAAANTETAVKQQQHQPEAPAQQQQQPEKEEWRFQGAFERAFRFPERIDAANVRASLRNGLLSITVPKAKAPEVKRILIQ